ncbi:hypothetical protein GDO78_022674 [Eleutherodactylus coqui]|uniref:G-protein coupled receptors family 1 profile domain-containing protein n=2 Tax=Eleutherodactylus coqui TaxID=57060 RepID=A0A8J6EG12_ELECQ|nr:hypothetical protein GDO78_022674 [Eleutherodactylus coqui]
MYWDIYNSPELQALSPNTTHPSAIQYSSFVLSIITCIIGLPANIIVIFVTGFSMKKNKYKIWFLNLALADFNLLLFLPFYAESIRKGEWPYSSFMCQLYHFFTFLNMYAGIYMLTALNIVRALSVAKPIWHRRFHSWKFCWCTCAVIWVLAVIGSTPVVFSDVNGGKLCSLSFYDPKHLANISSFNSEKNQTLHLLPREDCKYVSVSDPEVKKTWNNMVNTKTHLVARLSVLGYGVPLCVILLCNIIIAHHVKNSKMATSSRLYRLIIVTVMSFFCTRTPYVLAFITFLVFLSTMKFSLMYKLSIAMPMLFSIAATKSLLNPLVYVLIVKEVKSEIGNFLGRRRNSMRATERRESFGLNQSIM